MARWEYGIASHIPPPFHITTHFQNPPTMPRVVQPGGGGGKIRVRYTVRRKHGLIAASKQLVAEGMTL